MSEAVPPPGLPDWALTVSSELHDRMGIHVTTIGTERVIGTMPVEGNRQPLGFLHGGASAVLIEGLASLGATAYALSSGRVAAGVDLNVTHLRVVREGLVTGTATPIHLGGRVAVYEVTLADELGRRTAIGRLTCQLVAAH